jgi:glutathione S-transferase
MSKLQILGAPQSNFVWVTRIVATEKGIPYDLEPVFPHTPTVDAVHPFGKIPAMRHGEVALCESRAICQYIDRAFEGPSLCSGSPAQSSRTEQWVSILCTHVDLLLMRQYAGAYFFPKTADGNPDRKLIDSVLAAMKLQFEKLDRAVTATGYLAGDSFTLADAYLVPILYYMDQLPESSRMLAECSNLRDYLARHLQRPSVKTTIPPPMSALQLRAAS